MYVYRPVYFRYYEISEISCIVNLQYRAISLTSGILPYIEYNFGTVTEHNTH